MKTKKIRQLAAKILDCGTNQVWFNSTEMEKIQSAMTKEDIKGIIREGAIAKKKKNSQSRSRARELAAKKKKGRKKSFGSRRGKKTARMETKKKWITKVRALRQELEKLEKEKPEAVEKIGHRKLYRMINGNFFKGRRYLVEFVTGKGAKQ